MQPQSIRKFEAGVPLSPDHPYSRTIVVPKTKAEDTAWLDEELPDIPKAVYVADDQTAPLHPPRNKGNEAMVYLSYIIDHYHNLSDISIFIHASRWAWHNNDLFDNDTAMLIKHLIPQRVVRLGYVNLRCQWHPGCPAWLTPRTTTIDDEKKEEGLVKGFWAEVFPSDPLPLHLAQPCCSQFALSRDRIRAIPLSEYVRLRQWLLDTKIPDGLAGRLFEYTWQYLWTGAAVVCPSQHECYCDAFGACFESEEDFQSWFEMRYYVRRDEWELLKWQRVEEDEEEPVGRGRESGKRPPEEGRMEELRRKIVDNWMVLLNKREGALKNGRDPWLRAKIAGREVDAGDGLVDV
jgi:hypothetical protein